MLAIVDGEKVKAMRKEAGLDSGEFCKRAGISESTCRKIEEGEHRVTAKTAWKIAGVFGVEAEELARPAQMSRAVPSAGSEVA